MRWIPDFQHLHLPELFSLDERRSRDASMQSVASHPGIVILSSNAALEDFLDSFPGARCTPRVWSFHSLLEPSPIATVQDAFLDAALPEKFLYVPNQFWVHKNHIVLFRALGMLRDTYGLIVPVVCTGSPMDTRSHTHHQMLLDYLAQHDLDDQVTILGLLPRNQQLLILRRCAAVVQPSLFEGWSTVVEDARAIGRPLLLSDIEVHREQMPGSMFFFDPHSPKSLAHLIAEQWPDLRPGPDADAEAKAKADTMELIIAAARRFVLYCQEADQLAKRGTTTHG
jgi:glycosyltransferase involved in cell wall biosynthesis